MTVDAFLTVQHVAEFEFEGSWFQVRPGGDARRWRGVRWGSWWRGGFDDEDLTGRPCRVVPIGEAEGSPDGRGPSKPLEVQRG